jgi:hypothetical protein
LSNQLNPENSYSEYNPVDPGEFEHLIKDDKTSTSELLQELRTAANVYIDNRSYGNYFEEKAQIHGAIAGRDYGRNTTSFSKEIVGQVLIENIEKIHSVYTKTTHYTQAHSVLDEKHLLILWGDPNFGKQTTAVHLLSSLSGNDSNTEVFEINPTIEDFSLFQPSSGKSYLIDTLTPADENKRKIDEYTLKELSQKLRQANSYLVVTVDSRWHVFQEMFDQYVLGWRTLPDCEQVLEKHLSWYLDNQKSLTNNAALIQDDSVQDLLKNKLLPGDIDRLAELLSKVVRRELEREEALSRFSIHVRQQIRLWFERNSDFGERIFFTSLAVLSGSKYQAVDDASQRLISLTNPPYPEVETHDSNSIFEITRSSFLKNVCAELSNGFENTEHGLISVEIIKLQNSSFQPAILSYVWHEYNRLREPLLIWLHELGASSSVEVRSRAAAAAGELSKYDFLAVLDIVLRPWANSQDKRLRKLAALSLSVPIFDSGLAPQVLGLLHSWSGLNNNYCLRWTATVAYGGYVGLRFPDIALRDLFMIAQSGNRYLFLPVAESITALFKAGNFLSGQYLNVLTTIQGWTEPENKSSSKLLALLIFWQLIHKAKLPSGSGHSHIPIILWFIREERQKHSDNPQAERLYESTIICLLIRSFTLKRTRKLILEELHNWLKIADYDQRFYPTLGGIFYNLAVCGTDHERERILHYLERWASFEASNTASKILLKIKNHLNSTRLEQSYGRDV